MISTHYCVILRQERCEYIKKIITITLSATSAGFPLLAELISRLGYQVFRMWSTILDLLQQDGIQAEHASRGELIHLVLNAGAWTGFSWPERANTNGRFMGGRFVCRGCGFNGDAVAYLKKGAGLSFLDAVKHLGIDPGPDAGTNGTPGMAAGTTKGRTGGSVAEQRPGLYRTLRRTVAAQQ